MTFAGWAATIGVIVVLFAIDLFVSRPGHAHTVGFGEAVTASIFFVSVALGFGVAFGVIAGWDFGTEYFAGYIVEKSLSVDNLFVFVVIMSTFAVPAEHQQRVLTFGILVALAMRAVFIALGSALISAFSFMFVLFGLLLVYTAIQLFRHRDQDPDVDDNALVRLTRRLIPVTTDYHDGRNRGGRRLRPRLTAAAAVSPWCPCHHWPTMELDQPCKTSSTCCRTQSTRPGRRRSVLSTGRSVLMRGATSPAGCAPCWTS